MSSGGCIFCAIIERHIEAKWIHETESIAVIQDRSPKAPVHYLIIPKIHAADVLALQGPLVEKVGSDLLATARFLGEQLPSPAAFRLVVNNGKEVGQSVFHLHLHFLAGKLFNDDV
ncbi:MAG: HIT domain-containing protein [Candidatus Babeliales bacterium]